LATYEPDVLAEDLEVVFCGINPATTAAAAGHNFSNGSNRFWTALE
jgi:TDG/mug DNA glycosylase family protein